MSLQQKTAILRLTAPLVILRELLFSVIHGLTPRCLLPRCCSLIDEGGDWDRRNRLKVYKGVYSMAIRDFKTAARLFLDTLATFTSYELMDYEKFVTYTVFCGVIALERPEIRNKVVRLIALERQRSGIR